MLRAQYTKKQAVANTLALYGYSWYVTDNSFYREGEKLTFVAFSDPNKGAEILKEVLRPTNWEFLYKTKQVSTRMRSFTFQAQDIKTKCGVRYTGKVMIKHQLAHVIILLAAIRKSEEISFERRTPIILKSNFHDAHEKAFFKKGPAQKVDL